MEITVLGTFYPLDIKQDMLSCVITNRKINAEAHTSEISFLRHPIFKNAFSNKNVSITRGIYKTLSNKEQYQTMNKVAPSWVFLLYISHTLAYISEHWAELPLGRKVKQLNYLLFFKHFVQNTCCMTSCAGEENFAVKSDPKMETSKESLLLFSPSSATNNISTKEWDRDRGSQTETEVIRQGHRWPKGDRDGQTGTGVQMGT